jgi:hypothetical protein
MTIRNIAASLVLGLLFASLVVIYLVTPQNNGLVTFLSVIIMAVSLMITLNGGWREIGVMGIFAALVSVVAARFVGQARWGTLGGVVIPILWLGVLVLVFRWISRNKLVVQSDRAIIMQNTYTGALHIVPPPLSPPPLPQMQRIVAVIPKYELSQDVSVEKINTQAGQNIDKIIVHVYYRVNDPLAAMSFRDVSGIPNRGRVQKTIAKEMDQELEVARRDVAFWERMLYYQIQTAIDDIVRTVIWIWDSAQVSNIADAPSATGATQPVQADGNGAAAAQPAVDKPPPGAVDAYKQREQLSSEIQLRLNQQVANWGVKILKLELERIEIDPERFKVLGRAKMLERETAEERIKAEREATRIKLISEAEAEAEARRVSELISSLRESGVQLSDEKLKEIVIDAILSSEEWERGDRY